MTTLSQSPLFEVERLGVLMAPDPNNPFEVEGVLNPAGAYGPDGKFYLFPRLVGEGNFSRIGLARVVRSANGSPCGVERLGVALEPAAPYEQGGCEDPRVTHVACMDIYVMAYTAFGPTGPHVALATSHDLHSWTRCGLVDFACEDGVDYSRYFNKDAILFPEPVRAPDGSLALALLHRPVYEERLAGEDGYVPVAPPPTVADDRPSIWVSYCPVDNLAWLEDATTPRFAQHNLVAAPEEPWEAYRIGAGTVPLRTDDGWLVLYHGVELLANGDRCYRVGTLLFDHDDPRIILERSVDPIFGPETDEECVGVVANVCFPTAIDSRANGLDVYYGAADAVICCAHLRLISAAVANVA